MQVHPPDEMSPEGWLVEYDSCPRWLPAWPASSRLALVCVRLDQETGETDATVVLSPQALRELADPQYGLARLFFKVPRTVLLEEGRCPGLTPESFWKGE